VQAGGCGEGHVEKEGDAMSTPQPTDPEGASSLEPGIEDGQQLTDAGALEEDGSGRERPNEDVGEQALREAEKQSGLAPEVQAPYDSSGGRGESGR
jgi:hypothetical protein